MAPPSAPLLNPDLLNLGTVQYHGVPAGKQSTTWVEIFSAALSDILAEIITTSITTTFLFRLPFCLPFIHKVFHSLHNTEYNFSFFLPIFLVMTSNLAVTCKQKLIKFDEFLASSSQFP